MIYGKKRYDNGSLICILVILLVITVACHLTALKALCAVEHDVNYAYVCKNCSYPLTEIGISGNAADKYSGPENDLSEIVRATANSIKAVHCNHVGTKLLLLGFLLVGNSLKHKTR